MCPIGVGKSSTKASQTSAQTSQNAQFWAILIGVNEYQDPKLISLQYSAADCQELSKALAGATEEFSQRELLVHYDYGIKPPTKGAVIGSLKQVAKEAKAHDRVMFYFSGHGVLDPRTQQAALCLQDTTLDHLSATGLPISELLALLGECVAPIQFVWLDACHSGGVSWQQTLYNPTPQLIERLQERAARTQGFYALLSCDRAQRKDRSSELGN